MKIGFDLDNTIAIYEKVFSELGKKLSNVPAEYTENKTKLADYLRNNGREAEWTKLQGEAYGPHMKHAIVAPYFKETLQKLLEQGKACYVVSHRTKHPDSGAQYNLHATAKKWLLKYFRNSFTDIYFEETIEKKIERIHMLELEVFVDDLEKVLKRINLPKRNLFQYGPKNEHSEWMHLKDWNAFQDLIR